MFGYATVLRSAIMTAWYFDHYEDVPKSVQEAKLLIKAKGEAYLPVKKLFPFGKSFLFQEKAKSVFLSIKTLWKT